MQDLVSVQWLKENWKNPELIILDASIKDTVTNVETTYPNKRIKGARFFDIKNKFSDTSMGLPNTLPTSEQFTCQAQALGIHKNSIIIV